MKTTDFIKKAKEVHNNKYEYVINEDNVLMKSKVRIICPIHGEYSTYAYDHLKGIECRKCAYEKNAKKQTDTLESFISKAKLIHNNTYDYSESNYVSSQTKIKIICPIHGEFWQTPNSHLHGSGCPKCGKIKIVSKLRLTTEQFVEKARKIHGDKYDYSKAEYVNNGTKVCIICPIHGEFWQTPGHHLGGEGCSRCRYEKNSKEQMLSNDSFVQRAKEIHGERFDYSKVVYKGYEEKVCIICPIHGEFWQSPDSHLHSSGCPKCGGIMTKDEDAICEYIESLGLSTLTKNRKIIPPYELDIYIPENNIAIEFNGLYWHSDCIKEDVNYHLNKTIACEKLGIRLIHIFEDEWNYNKEIVKSKLRHIIGVNDTKSIYARKCIVNEIDNKTAKEFLLKNHIQGFSRSTVYLGCYYNDELISVMSLLRERKNTDNWELTRFASDINKCCVGVAGKMFKYFVRQYNPYEVKTFADRRWSSRLSDNLYDKLGFSFVEYLNPSYSYFFPKEIKDKRIHKFNCRKNILLKKYPEKLNENMTESEMTKKLGFYKIWDCGLIKYKWFNKN